MVHYISFLYQEEYPELAKGEVVFRVAVVRDVAAWIRNHPVSLRDPPLLERRGVFLYASRRCDPVSLLKKEGSCSGAVCRRGSLLGKHILIHIFKVRL